MNKVIEMTKKRKMLNLTAVCCSALWITACGVTDWIAPSTESVTTTETTTEKRHIETTKTAVYSGDVDDDDEDYEGYTSSTSLTGGTLENEYSRPDLYDENIRATATVKTTVKTYYTLPDGRGVSETSASTSKTTKTTTETTTTKETTTTTAFKADALYKLSDEMKYGSSKSFTVTSDTTYLNLRFGPSKKYDVQLRIPDGASINGSGETSDADGNVWVYVSYNGTAGWVMKELLS